MGTKGPPALATPSFVLVSGLQVDFGTEWVRVGCHGTGPFQSHLPHASCFLWTSGSPPRAGLRGPARASPPLDSKKMAMAALVA